MNAKRLLAIFAAVAMIIGAVVARRAVDDNNNGAADDRNPDASALPVSDDEPRADGVITMVCSTEFAGTCQALKAIMGSEVSTTVEPAGATLDRLAKVGGAELPDLWLTLDPYPGMLDIARGSGAGAVKSATALASSDQQVAVSTPRTEAIEQGCASTPLWSCIGDGAGQPWSAWSATASAGAVEVGLADPASEASGLLAFAQGVAGYLGTTDFGSNDWQADSGFPGWLRNLSSQAQLSSASRTPLATLLTQASKVNVAATTAQELETTGANRNDKYVVFAPEQQIPFTAVVAAFGAADARLQERVTEAIRSDLESTGWQQASDISADPGVFVALRQLWKDNT